jgi:glutamine amidotransferase
MIVIVQCGLGNTGSILNMLKKAGIIAKIISSPDELTHASKVILPGVGHFDYGMIQLRQNGWIDILNKKVLNEKLPVLGICLGMQMMCRSSEEGKEPGLGWLDAEVKKFVFESPEIKVPHMGWNFVQPLLTDTLFQNFTETPRFYFVHSYYVQCKNPFEVLAYSEYHTQKFVSAFRKENIFGVQFHPEKSHVFGLQILKNFVQL